MTRSTQTKSPSKDQFKEFRKATRELGANATDEQFQGALRKIAKAKPSPNVKKSRPST